MIFWLKDLSVRIESDYVYFFSSLSHTIPAALILFVKPNEDCFTCFNRCAPDRFSYFQFSLSNLLLLNLTDDQKTDLSRRAGSFVRKGYYH